MYLALDRKNIPVLVFLLNLFYFDAVCPFTGGFCVSFIPSVAFIVSVSPFTFGFGLVLSIFFSLIFLSVVHFILPAFRL